MRRTLTLSASIAALCLSMTACGGGEGSQVVPDEPPTDIIHVNASATTDGNGSESTPFRTISDALGVETASTILVAPGTYEVPTEHTFPADLSIEATAGVEETFFISRAATEPVQWEAQGNLSVSGVTFFVGLALSGKAISLQDIAASGQDVGLSATGLESLSVRGATIEQGTGIALDNIASATFEGLTLDGATVGLTAEAVGALSLSQSTISNVNGPAIGLKDTEATLRQITISDITQPGDIGGDGIHVTGGSLDFEGGAVSGVADRGVALIMGATGTLKDLVLDGGIRAMLFVSHDAIAVGTNLNVSGSRVCTFSHTNASLTLIGSQIGPCGGNGLLVGDGARAVITDSVFKDCPMGHISYLGGASGRVEGSTFENSVASSCVSTAGITDEMVIKDNRISKCSGMGVALLTTHGARVEGNHISEISADPPFTDVGEGISLVDSSADIVGNTVTDVDKRGIALLRSSGLIENNEIGPTGDAAVNMLDPGPGDTTITNNIIQEAFGAGIAVFNARADITNNNISGTRLNVTDSLGEGIVFAAGATANIDGNVVEGSANNGIVFTQGASGSIGGNTLRDNNLYGIFEFCGALNDVAIGNNTFENNGQGEASTCN